MKHMKKVLSQTEHATSICVFLTLVHKYFLLVAVSQEFKALS